MKSLAELTALRDKMQSKVIIREQDGGKRIVVGMATCGIAAGARPVLNAFVEEVNKAGIADVAVTQTGCIVTYVKMTAEKAARVVEEHIKGGKVVEEYTIGAFKK